MRIADLWCYFCLQTPPCNHSRWLLSGNILVAAAKIWKKKGFNKQYKILFLLWRQKPLSPPPPPQIIDRKVHWRDVNDVLTWRTHWRDLNDILTWRSTCNNGFQKRCIEVWRYKWRYKWILLPIIWFLFTYISIRRKTDDGPCTTIFQSFYCISG